MTNLLVIPDENFFHILIKNDIDLKIFEYIENNYGKIIVDNSVYKLIIDLIRSIDDGNKIRNLTYYLDKANDQYNEELEKIFSKNPIISYSAIEDEIDSLSETYKKIINQFNSGVSKIDSSFFALAHFLKLNNDAHSIIISEDSGVLVQGNFISSYFGTGSFIVSFFELLRNYSNEDYVEKYFTYYNLNGITCHSLKHTLRKSDYELYIRKLMKKNLLSTHPKIPSRRVFNNIH